MSLFAHFSSCAHADTTCVVAILLAVLTVSPKTEYFGVFCPITPAECNNPWISSDDNPTFYLSLSYIDSKTLMKDVICDNYIFVRPNHLEFCKVVPFGNDVSRFSWPATRGPECSPIFTEVTCPSGRLMRMAISLSCPKNIYFTLMCTYFASPFTKREKKGPKKTKITNKW
jgi:hypothetical protein